MGPRSDQNKSDPARGRRIEELTPHGTEVQRRVLRRGEFLPFCRSLVGYLGAGEIPMQHLTWCEHSILAFKEFVAFCGGSGEADEVTISYIEAIKGMEDDDSGLIIPYKMARSHALVQDARDPQEAMWHSQKNKEARERRKKNILAARMKKDGDKKKNKQDTQQVADEDSDYEYDEEDSEEENDTDHPRFPPTDDMYQFLTWKWIRKTVEIETNAVSNIGGLLFWLCTLQCCISVAVLGIGSREFDGGDVTETMTTVILGSVGILASILLGARGAIAESEALIRFFFQIQLWMIALLTAYIYVSFNFLLRYDGQCASTTDVSVSTNLPNNSAAEQCDVDKKWLIIRLAINVTLLITCVVATALSLDIVDTFNTKESLTENMMIFKYFQRKLDEVELQIQHEQDRRDRKMQQEQAEAEVCEPPAGTEVDFLGDVGDPQQPWSPPNSSQGVTPVNLDGPSPISPDLGSPGPPPPTPEV
eukprot:Hpha_TRINITY_DN15856_c0_g4::TRINITY_DN15856_c0_g4_i2::g.189962::m.189962